MPKAKILICIGTMGRPTFNRCYESVLKAQKAFSQKTDLHIIKNKSPQSEWLNSMRKAALGWDWCFQIDEDMYLYENAFEDLYSFAILKSKKHKILSASSLLYDIFMERKIGSFKIWKSESLKTLRFRDVLGSDRDIAKRGLSLGYKTVSTKIVLADHDSAPNEEAAYKKYYKCVEKLKKFGKASDVSYLLNYLRKKSESGCKISISAYMGGMKASGSGLILDNSNNEKISLNDYFDKIYCLNLDHRTDRWDNCRKKFEKLGINVERFSASGKEDAEVINNFNRLKLKIPKEEDRKKKAMITSVGAMGCLVSHINILRDARVKGYKRVLILEDDVIFIKDFLKKIKAIEYLKKWDLLYLGSSQHSWSNINTNKAEKNGFYRSNRSCGTFAYAVNHTIYDKLIKSFYGLEKPVDEYLCLYQKKSLNSFVLYPNLIIADVSDSDIRGGRDQISHSKRLRWRLKDYDL